MSTKVVIAVLIGVVVLFVVAVVLGAGQPDGDASAEEQEGPVGSLLDSAKGQGDAPLSQLSGPCLQPGGLVVVQFGCELRVAPADERLRTVRLTVQNGTVTVAAPAPDPEGESERELRKTLELGKQDSEQLTVAVGPDGAVIALSCSSCQLLVGG